MIYMILGRNGAGPKQDIGWNGYRCSLARCRPGCLLVLTQGIGVFPYPWQSGTDWTWRVEEKMFAFLALLLCNKVVHQCSSCSEQYRWYFGRVWAFIDCRLQYGAKGCRGYVSQFQCCDPKATARVGNSHSPVWSWIGDIGASWTHRESHERSIRYGR